MQKMLYFKETCLKTWQIDMKTHTHTEREREREREREMLLTNLKRYKYLLKDARFTVLSKLLHFFSPTICYVLSTNHCRNWHCYSFIVLMPYSQVLKIMLTHSSYLIPFTPHRYKVKLRFPGVGSIHYVSYIGLKRINCGNF